ncbi:hypothetical protein CI109_105580 [Kwoniella shandongensis]|uniref:Uncharacterized protein n=1 Tax=Kwoniella shandongensis TaxID=1734106 RepID=A0A5M6C2Z3_9TREE|nr:uncharacterized protein CI109_002297 [Kwoniella shandongensis]KAA5529404.1 hypothetical protein CI109_002297 [Kwoniella shandongensis]
MRLQTFILPLILFIIPLALATNPTDCSNTPTRDPTTCQCLPGFLEPGYSKRGGGANGCVCPDAENTNLVYNYVNGKKTPLCVCIGDHQIYNTDAQKCECKPGYQSSTYNNHLTCKPPTTSTPCESSTGIQPSGTGGFSGYRKRALNAAIERREMGNDARAVEETLGCKLDEKACEAEGTWTCTDITSSLSSCGGCPGDGVDCGALPGVSQVRCVTGNCVIDTCQRGYVLNYQTNAEGATTTSNVTCVPKHHRPWFMAQGSWQP